MDQRYPKPLNHGVTGLLLAGVLLWSGSLFAPVYAAEIKPAKPTTPAKPKPHEAEVLKLTPIAKLIVEGKYQAAVSTISTIIAKDPTNAPAYCMRGYVYALLNNMDKALADMDKAVELDPKWPTAYCRRAAVYIEQDRLDKALTDIDKAIALDPALAEPYWLRSFIYERRMLYKEEIEDCTKAISINPNEHKYYLNRATARRQLEQYQAALADASMAIKLNPRSSKTYIERGYINKCMGNGKASIDDYTQAIKLLSTPASTDAKSKTLLAESYTLRGEAYAKLKQSDKYIADLNTAIKIAPADISLVRQRGHAYYNAKQYQKALDDYTVLLKKTPPDDQQYSWRADTYEMLGQYHNQIADLTQAVNLKPQSARVWQKRAYAHYKIGMLKEALDDCNKADAIDPKDTDQSYTASYIHEDQGQYAKALEYKSKILDAEKKSAFAWSNRARLNQMVGNLEEAAKDRVKANELASPTERAEMQGCSNLISFASATPQHPEQDIRDKLDTAPVVIPYKYDDGGHIRVPAKVNGRDIEMMLDTGCGHSDLWIDKLADIAKPDETKMTAKMANGSDFSYSSLRADKLQLGSLELNNVRLAIVPGLPKHRYLSGFFGGNIMEHMVVTIDYQKKEILFNSSAKTYKTDTAIVVPMMVRNHMPLCMVKVENEIERMALIDTGCPFGMAPYALVQPVIKTPLTFDESISGPWLGDLQSKKVMFKTIALNAKPFADVILDVYKEGQAQNAAHEMVLGNDFLSSFKSVTFDYPGRQLILEPAEPGYKSALALYHEGRYLQSHGEAQRSVAPFTKSITLEPELAEDGYYYRAKAYIELKQYKPALDDANILVKLDPKAAWAYYQRARVYDELKDYKHEIEDLTTAINLDPDFKFAYSNRADAFEKIGQKELAKRDRRMGKE